MEEDQPLCTKNTIPSTFEVTGCLQVASKTRSAALLGGAIDSPSEALEVVEMVASDMAGKNFHPKGSVENSNKDRGDPTTSFYTTTHHCTDKGKRRLPLYFHFSLLKVLILFSKDYLML